MGTLVSLNQNGRRRDLPLEKRLGWDGIISVTLSVIVACIAIWMLTKVF